MGIVITIALLWLLCGALGAYLYTEVFGLQYSMDFEEIFWCTLCGPIILFIVLYEVVGSKCPKEIFMSQQCREHRKKG